MFFLFLSALWFLQTNKIDVTKRMQSYEISIEKTNNYRLLTKIHPLPKTQTAYLSYKQASRSTLFICNF